MNDELTNFARRTTHVIPYNDRLRELIQEMVDNEGLDLQSIRERFNDVLDVMESYEHAR